MTHKKNNKKQLSYQKYNNYSPSRYEFVQITVLKAEVRTAKGKATALLVEVIIMMRPGEPLRLGSEPSKGKKACTQITGPTMFTSSCLLTASGVECSSGATSEMPAVYCSLL